MADKHQQNSRRTQRSDDGPHFVVHVRRIGHRARHFLAKDFTEAFPQPMHRAPRRGGQHIQSRRKRFVVDAATLRGEARFELLVFRQPTCDLVLLTQTTHHRLKQSERPSPLDVPLSFAMTAIIIGDVGRMSPETTLCGMNSTGRLGV